MGIATSAATRQISESSTLHFMAKFNDIQLLRTTYLRGPSVWTYRPVLEVWLDLGELEDYPSNKIPGLNERLTTWLPDLVEHHCGVGERGGFLLRLKEGTWMGHVLEHVVIELLNLSGMPAEFGQTREISRRGVYRMVFRCPEEAVARVALEHGHRLLMAAINDEAFDLKAAIHAIKTAINDRYLGPSTGCIVDAASARRIPHIRLNDGNLVQLGYGAAQRRIWTAESDQTSAIAEGIAQDKDFTKRLLASCGVPVPEGQIVRNADEAWEVAQEIGFPVTVKPSDGNHARGVTLELSREADIKAAFALAEPEGSDVIVEKFIDGVEHRLLVVGGKVVAATKGETVSVHGNGQSTLRELVAVLNEDPRRGPEQEYPLDWIDVEKGAVQLELKRQGVTPDTVVPSGQAIVEHLFPVTDEGAGTGTGAGRIPIVGIAGTRHNAFTARFVGWLLQLSGKLTGVASSEGMFLNNRRTQKSATAHWAGAHRLLTNRLAQAAVIQTTARSILEEGLAYDRCLVGVVTDMDGFETLADHDVLEQAQMTRVLRTQIDVVLDEGAGVLNADIEQVADLARLCDGEVLLYSLSPDNPFVAAHRAEGEGRAVFVRGEQVVLATGASERVLGTLDALSLPGGHRPDTAAMLAAIAAAWSMDIGPDLIAAGIKTFDYAA